MNRQASGTQALRSMSGNTFASQAAAARNQPASTPRAPNGKLGGSSTWGFGVPMTGGAPGLSNPPARTSTMPNFAQAIGGGPASQGPLDLSEFPSLSGGPQVQSQNAMPQAWNSNALRNSTTPQPQNPVQRPPGQIGGPQREPSGQQEVQPQQSHQQENTFGGFNGVEGQLDGQRMAPMRSDNQAQMGATDDFPPLGGVLNGERHERESGILQAPGFGAPVQVNGQSESSGTMSIAGLESMRSPSETHRTPSSLQEGQPLPYREARQMPASQASTGQQTQLSSSFGGSVTDSPSAQQTQQRRTLAEMTASERWGLPGLLAQLPTRGDTGSNFFLGVDLSTLGVDLDSAEPLFPTFSTPFADVSARPVIPEFALPAAYSVNNVPALHTRMSNFADETLFAIFYQFTRDVMQEIAAAELYTRDWRWHKELRQWMMKDQAVAAPIRISERQERGVYVFFDAMNWKRERREFILNYDHLDQRHGPTQPTAT